MKDLISGKNKTDQTVEGIGIILSNISKGSAFLYQGVIYMIQCKRFIRA